MITASLLGGQAGGSRPGETQGICACGAVYAYGNVEIDPRFVGMCMRCAVANGFRPGRSCTPLPAAGSPWFNRRPSGPA